MANVVIAKMGRSIYFDRKKWKDGAGNNEAPCLFSSIVNLQPENTYYLIGKSDFSRVSDDIRKEWFKHDNVIDVWAAWEKGMDPTTFIWEQLKEVKIDYGVVHGGMVSLSIPGRIYCLDRKTGKPDYDKLRSPIMSLVNYVSPITYYLNESKINWLTITSDGRYMPMEARDLINPEKISLGVKEGIKEFKRMKSYEDQETMVTHKLEMRYAAAEFQYLLDEKVNRFQYSEPKTQKIAFFFHQYDNKKRIKALKEFIDIFNEDEIAVYGKWDEQGGKYKGSVPFDELQTILPAVKYTLCYPIIEGDISAKWVEAVRSGVIPFLHHTYDSDRLLVKYHNVPEWLYVKSPEDMKEKIKFLEGNSHAYHKLKNILISNVHSAKYMNGSHYVNLINQAVKDMERM